MKKFRISLIAAFIIAIAGVVTFQSCEKKKLNYSCDSNINEYVIEHKNEYASITRDNIATLPFQYQVPVFRSLDNENKWSIYKQKIQLVLKIDTSLNSEDVVFLNSLLKLSTKEIYSGDGEVLTAKIKKYCIENLKWSLERYIFTLETFVTKEEMIKEFEKRRRQAYTDSLFSENKVNNKPGGGTPPPLLDCVCRYDIACMWSGSACYSGNCNATYGGCGVFGSASCRGTCNGLPF